MLQISGWVGGWGGKLSFQCLRPSSSLRAAGKKRRQQKTQLTKRKIRATQENPRTQDNEQTHGNSKTKDASTTTKKKKKKNNMTNTSGIRNTRHNRDRKRRATQNGELNKICSHTRTKTRQKRRMDIGALNKQTTPAPRTERQTHKIDEQNNWRHNRT
jgi:hypothetical protein